MDFLDLFAQTFKSGGALMWPLAALALYMYWLGFGTCLRMGRWNKICASDRMFSPAYEKFVSEEFFGGALSGGELCRCAYAPESAKKYFSALRLKLMSGSDRRLKTLKILSGVAPLIGLLGTVCGMTLSIASAGVDSAEVASGVSAALVTTQAGLVVAIPAWIMAMVAAAQSQKLLINLARREAAVITGELS